MAKNSKIEWCDHTFNPWIGCTRVSPACDNCYAAVSTPARTKNIQWGAGQARQKTKASTWMQPLTWNRNHAAFFAEHGRRQRVFCSSLADVFDNDVLKQWRLDLADLILQTPFIDWLFLTKRIGNAAKMLREMFPDGLPKNVWVGATICNQQEAERDIPKLLDTPAAKRFLSIEPMLGPINLTDISDGHADRTIPRSYWQEGFDTHESPPAVGHNALTGERWQRFGEWNERTPNVDWVIGGGESGKSARPMHPDWVRSLRDQCEAAGVPFFFKQWGEWTPGENVKEKVGVVKTATWFGGEWSYGSENLQDTEGHIDDEPDLYRVGKASAGRLLDGRTWNKVPGVEDALPKPKEREHAKQAQ